MRDGSFICAVFRRQRGLHSSRVDRTALAASALLRLSGFVVSAVAPSLGSWGKCRLELRFSLFLEVRLASEWVVLLLFSLNVFVGNYKN